jgi:hypothetical protein
MQGKDSCLPDGRRTALPLLGKSELERTDERRFFVFDVDDSKKQDSVYFSAIQNELDAGRLEAMLYDLQTRGLSAFDIRP